MHVTKLKTCRLFLNTARLRICMLADIGTKALSDKQFCYLRDQLTGYALVKKHHPTYAIPAYVFDEKENG